MHKNPDGLDKKLDVEAQRNLYQWYAKDFVFLKMLEDNNLVESSVP